MKRITLRNTLPNVFSQEPHIKSDVWQEEISFEKGNCYLIEANSGTGKSSLCSYLYGYRNDYSGDILFDDNNIERLTSKQWDQIRCSEISLLFQELCLFSELTAFENVLLKNNLTGYKSDKQLRDLFDILGIANKMDTPVAKMSWGQQQRVAIIRCLCQPFDFIILDEPISHLDDKNAQIISELLYKEASERGASMIATSIGKHLPLNYTKTFSL